MNSLGGNSVNRNADRQTDGILLLYSDRLRMINPRVYTNHGIAEFWEMRYCLNVVLSGSR